MNPNSPKPYPSAAVKVRLLQDAVYSEDMDLWTVLLRYRSHIESYFQEIGLELTIHEEDGFAYLKQAEQDDSTPIPRLFRRDKLTRGVAVLGVLLRERLLQFDEKVHDESRLIVAKEDIIQMATPFFPETNDEIRADKRIETAINKAEETGLLRKLPSNGEDENYEVRRIIKARFPVETLNALREQLQIYADSHDGQ